MLNNSTDIPSPRKPSRRGRRLGRTGLRIHRKLDQPEPPLPISEPSSKLRIPRLKRFEAAIERGLHASQLRFHRAAARGVEPPSDDEREVNQRKI